MKITLNGAILHESHLTSPPSTTLPLKHILLFLFYKVSSVLSLIPSQLKVSKRDFTQSHPYENRNDDERGHTRGSYPTCTLCSLQNCKGMWGGQHDFTPLVKLVLILHLVRPTTLSVFHPLEVGDEIEPRFWIIYLYSGIKMQSTKIIPTETKRCVTSDDTTTSEP